MKLFIKVRYLGTNYCGYQVQPNAPSIQGELNKAARTLFGYDCDIVGCSRTDSGVHANEFCATVAQKGCDDLITSLPPERVPLAFSAVMIYVCLQRINEIKKGEEDDISKY
jgi:tRNA U38,U39,U40 pseudouridine synthase TruA